VALVASATAAEPSVVAVGVAQTAFNIRMSDGTMRMGLAAAGATLHFRVDGSVAPIHIASVASDPGSPVLLHDFRVGETGLPLCAPDHEGRRLGFPLAGRRTATGAFGPGPPGAFELICTSGAVGKCVRLGYHPWATAPDGRSMREYLNACIRMMRADYCGDGRSWTRDGTPIRFRGRADRQRRAWGRTDAFEAGWRATGAVCVRRTRIAEIIAPRRLQRSCPLVAVGARCDQRSAGKAGALIYSWLPARPAR
jgi:hypothetical protein